MQGLHRYSVEHDHNQMICRHRGVLVFDLVMHFGMLALLQMLILNESNQPLLVARDYFGIACIVIFVFGLAAFIGGLHRIFLCVFGLYGWIRVFITVGYIIIGFGLLLCKSLRDFTKWKWVHDPYIDNHWIGIFIMHGYYLGGSIFVIGWLMVLTHKCYTVGRQDMKENYVALTELSSHDNKRLKQNSSEISQRRQHENITTTTKQN